MIKIQKCTLIADCPNCGKKNDKPEKIIENSLFCIAVYTCSACGNNFKVCN